MTVGQADSTGEDLRKVKGGMAPLFSLASVKQAFAIEATRMIVWSPALLSNTMLPCYTTIATTSYWRRPSPPCGFTCSNAVEHSPSTR